MTEQKLPAAAGSKARQFPELLGLPRWLLFSLLSMFLWGVWGAVSKVEVPSLSDYQKLAAFTLGVLLSLALFARSKNLGVGGDKRRGAFWAFATGVCGGVGNVFFYLSLSHGGETSVVTPLTGVYPLVSVVLAVALLREKLNRVQAAGMGLAIAAMVLLNMEPSTNAAFMSEVISSWTIFALLALVLFGVAAITQKLSTNHISAELSYLWFGAALAVMAAVILLAQPVDWGLCRPAWLWPVLGGACNGLGVWASFVAYRSGGKASLVTPLAALYPIVTVALAVPFLGETVNARAAVGIALALAAAVALSHECDPKQASDGVW